MKLERPFAPDFLKENCKKWGHEFAEARLIQCQNFISALRRYFSYIRQWPQPQVAKQGIEIFQPGPQNPVFLCIIPSRFCKPG